MNYAVPARGPRAGVHEHHRRLRQHRRRPAVLGIKNSGADAVYLPLVAATNIAVVQGLAAERREDEVTVLATGYGQDLLDQPVARPSRRATSSLTGYKPVELKTTATKKFQADLKKYAGFTGVPDFGVYTGYITGDLAIMGLENAGKNPTRQGFVDGVHAARQLRPGRPRLPPVDVSLESYGKARPNELRGIVQVKDGKFVLFPKNGKPVTGKLVGSPRA